jgi:hypothetical protein
MYDTRLVFVCACARPRSFVWTLYLFLMNRIRMARRGVCSKGEPTRVVRRPKIHLAVPAAWGARWAEGVQLCILWMLVEPCCRALALLIVRCSHRHSYRQRRQPSELVEDDVDACAHNLHACS